MQRFTAGKWQNQDLDPEAPESMLACLSAMGGMGPGLNMHHQPAMYPCSQRTQAFEFAASKLWAQGGHLLGRQAARRRHVGYSLTLDGPSTPSTHL